MMIQITQINSSQVLFKTIMLNSRLCDYSDARIFGKEIITVANTIIEDAGGNVTNKKVRFKVCVLFTGSINEDKNLDVTMQM